MRRRITLPAILILVYFSIFIALYVVLPLFFNRTYSFRGFFPFFFFFPFFLGRRGFRNTNSNKRRNRSTAQPQQDDILNEKYDASKWEKDAAENYDEYGIRIKSDFTRYWYYIGMVVILVAAVILLLLKGAVFSL